MNDPHFPTLSSHPQTFTFQFYPRFSKRKGTCDTLEGSENSLVFIDVGKIQAAREVNSAIAKFIERP